VTACYHLLACGRREGKKERKEGKEGKEEKG
jgi:hypothetical protein